MFRTDTRTISKKGGFTIPVQVRRALGIYDKTQVDIMESKDPDVLMLVKSRPHCICCGKVGNSLVKVNRDSINPANSRFVCAECIRSLNSALAEGETIGHEMTTSDVIDNYNINLHRIDEIKKENAEYERLIQQEGLAKLGPEKTVTLAGKNSEIKVQVSYTVKEVTKAGYETLKSFMNENVSDNYLASNIVEKFDANVDFKEAAVIIYTEDWKEGTFKDTLTKYGYSDRIKPDILANLTSRWKFDNGDYNRILLTKALNSENAEDTGTINLDGEQIDALIKELTLVAKYNYVKHIFPKIKTCADFDLLRDCLIVNSCIKIKK